MVATRRMRLSAAVIAIALLAGCNSSDRTAYINMDGTTTMHGRITLHDGTAVVHAESAPDAGIGANGDFSIDGKPLAINAAERDLFAHYYSAVVLLQQHGIATGKAGAATAAAALKGVASGAAESDSSAFDKRMDAQAALVEQSAMKICQDLSDIKTTQDALAAQLPSFKPYADVVSGTDVQDCDKKHDR